MHDRMALFMAMLNRTYVELILGNGSIQCGLIDSIEMEDGSGWSFNISGNFNNVAWTVYYKVADPSVGHCEVCGTRTTLPSVRCLQHSIWL